MAVSALRKLREDNRLSIEAAARSLEPPMSWRTLHRWETNGIPMRRGEHRDSWLKQLAERYGVEVETFNGSGA